MDIKKVNLHPKPSSSSLSIHLCITATSQASSTTDHKTSSFKDLTNLPTNPQNEALSRHGSSLHASNCPSRTRQRPYVPQVGQRLWRKNLRKSNLRRLSHRCGLPEDHCQRWHLEGVPDRRAVHARGLQDLCVRY